MSKKLTTEEFIKKARKVHGDRYDYSKTEYIDSKNKVCIICSKHGEFWQTPNSHLSGYGCKKCAISLNAGNNMRTLEYFIEKASGIHGDKYDYSKSHYCGMLKKILIICPEHGEFWQTPANHLNGKGCPKCGIKKVWDLRGKTTTEDFIREAHLIHGDKYDYSKVEYVDGKTKVCIICPEHGEFWQTPDKHLKRKHECPKCGHIKLWDNRGRISTDDFIEKAHKIHCNKYNYSKVNYERANRKVCIICPEHGEFYQTPNKHLMGQGCPICSKLINVKESNLYLKLKEKYKDIEIHRQYHNTELFGRKSIDIYFPNKKIGIEYQGEQHFKPVNLFGGYDSFLKQCVLDKEKYDECKNNNIRLLYYTDEKRNIPKNYIDTVYTNFNALCEKIDGLLND